MTEAGSDGAMFSNRTSLGEEDIEAGSNNVRGNAVLIEEPIEKMVDGGNNKCHALDIDKWASSLTKILEDVPQYMCNPGHPGRISRIPENLREVDVKAYEPYFLSIGPYHHGKPSVKLMEKRKLVVLKCWLEQKPELTLKDFLKEIKTFEPAARSFYTDVEMESEKFVLMLLLDSLYILTLFCGMAKSQEGKNHTTRIGSSVDNEYTNERENEKDEGMGTNENTEMVVSEVEMNDETRSGENHTHKAGWFWTLLMHDLFLLENQLPFFVLQKLYDIAYGGSETQLIVTISNAFGILLLDYVKLDSKTVILPTEEVHHLLHLCHLFFRPTLQQESTACKLQESSQMFRLGSAMQLYEAGLSFEATSDSTQHSLLDIIFGRPGKMVIPCLQVDDNTDSLLRNLIALEQMKYPSLGLHVSAYAVLLLHLVTTPEDVKLLRRKGIIQHHLASDKEMMYFVNRLSVGLAFDYVEDAYSLKPVFQQLKRYTEHRVPQWRAWLKHRYFNNPWTAISLFAASLLLFLSTLQTYYAVYSYYHPYSDGQS